MNKLLYILGFALLILICFLVYKVWAIFGVWTLIWTGLVAAISQTVLKEMIGSKKVTADGVMFNPKEMPKLGSIAINLLLSYYLITILNNTELSDFDRGFGNYYIGIFALGPNLYALFTLFRDRNDFVNITQDNVQFKNNNETGEILLSSIIDAKIQGKDLELNMNNETSFVIKTSEMNINNKDLTDILSEINSRLVQIV
jgi:hypothetical protein